jgi:hypothetical protein
MFHSPIRVRSAACSMAAACVLTAVAAGGASAQSKGITTLQLTTMNGRVTTVDLGPTGKSPGDLYVYTGTVHRGAKQIGRIYGSNTSVVVEGRRETVSGQLSFRLGSGDEIVVGGLAEYPSDENSGFVVGKQFTRAVFGGTGRYAGARGTLMSTRLPSGNYKQVFRLLP